MIVVSGRIELIAFYLRRGYQQTGSVMDYPILAGVGTPKDASLKIEALEKRATDKRLAQVTGLYEPPG